MKDRKNTLRDKEIQTIRLLQDIIEEYTIKAKTIGSIGPKTFKSYETDIRKLRIAQEVLSHYN